MKQFMQTIRLGLAISLILTAFPVKADTSRTTTPDVKYRRWYNTNDGKIYHRFLPAPIPKELSYRTLMSATANIDDTPEKETVALVLVDVQPNKYVYPIGNWVQAFLLIANTQAGQLEKKRYSNFMTWERIRWRYQQQKPLNCRVHPLSLPNPRKTRLSLEMPTSHSLI
ncbi:MAG: hypothetical protein OYL97_14115 [Candidatus Poribacteria bacterium]|nr:hypothetical protein [Candidatus Poribacteria bacterium]